MRPCTRVAVSVFDLAVMLQEAPYVLVQKSGAPPVVDCREHLPGHDRDLRFMVGVRLLCWKDGR